MQTYETILATNQEIFFCKSSLRTKHNWHYAIGFLIYTAPLNVYFYYITIYFFVKNFFFRILIFQWIRYSNVICFLVEAIHYVRTQLGGWRGGSVIQNVYRCVQGERDIPPSVHVRTYTISFHVFVLWCLVLFIEI